MLYRLIFLTALFSFLISCGGGGGSGSDNTVQNPSPTTKVFSIYAEGCFGAVGFQIECSISQNVKTQDVVVKKGDFIKNWDLSSSVVNGKLKIIAYNKDLFPINSNNRILLFKIKAPDGTDINNITKKFVDISGVTIDTVNLFIEN